MTKLLRRRLPGMALLILLVALVTAACGPVHTDPRWASIEKIADGAQILLAFGDRLALVDTTDGKPVELLDPDGEVRLDENGNPRVWEVKGTGQGQTRFYTNPVILDPDTLLASSYDNKLLTIDFPVARADDSATMEQHIVAAPVVDGDLVYVGLGDHDLVALNRDDLTEVWRLVTGQGVWAEPLIVGETLYVGSMDHYLYAVNKATGEVLWKTDLKGALTSTPVYQDGHLYIGTLGYRIMDVSAETGAILAEFPTTEWVWSSPALVDNTLYVGDLGGTVYSIDVADGLTVNWQTQAAAKGIPPTPLVTENYVIVGSRDQNVYWLNRADGTVTDKKAVAGEVLANLLLVEPGETVDIPEPLVIVSTSAPQELLVAFTLERGQRVWAYGR